MLVLAPMSSPTRKVCIGGGGYTLASLKYGHTSLKYAGVGEQPTGRDTDTTRDARDGRATWFCADVVQPREPWRAKRCELKLTSCSAQRTAIACTLSLHWFSHGLLRFDQLCIMRYHTCPPPTAIQSSCGQVSRSLRVAGCGIYDISKHLCEASSRSPS